MRVVLRARPCGKCMGFERQSKIFVSVLFGIAVSGFPQTSFGCRRVTNRLQIASTGDRRHRRREYAGAMRWRMVILWFACFACASTTIAIAAGWDWSRHRLLEVTYYAPLKDYPHASYREHAWTACLCRGRVEVNVNIGAVRQRSFDRFEVKSFDAFYPEGCSMAFEWGNSRRWGFTQYSVPLWAPLLAMVGATTFVGWKTARMLRRRGQTQRGQCSNCGYDRRGLAIDAPCPECGKNDRLA